MSGVKRHAQSLLLEQTAKRFGVSATDMSEAWGRDALVLEHQGDRHIVLLGRVEGSLTHLAYTLTVDKWAARKILTTAGVPSPAALRFSFDPKAGETAAERDRLLAQLSERFSEGGRWVLKPRFGEYGRGVGMNIESVGAALHHLALHAGEDADWILERQAPGRDLRIQAIGGTLVAACVREPASVVGDGETTLRALAAAHDDAVRRNNPDNRLVIDDETVSVLSAQGLTLEDRPAVGRKVPLKATANMAKGGRAIDVTDALHPTFSTWVEKTAPAFGISVFSLDVIAVDPAAPATDEAWVIEVNAEPDWLHHTFSEGRRHDMAAHYLRFLFPGLNA